MWGIIILVGLILIIFPIVTPVTSLIMVPGLLFIIYGLYKIIKRRKHNKYTVIQNYIWYFILGLVLVLVSTPLSYSAVGIIYADKNLTGEYVLILNGFIHSFMLIGTLIFSVGLIKLIKLSKA